MEAKSAATVPLNMSYCLYHYVVCSHTAYCQGCQYSYFFWFSLLLLKDELLSDNQKTVVHDNIPEDATRSTQAEIYVSISTT